ncbi:MAG: hypothetical protein KBT36_08740 [Kurthia sp.]|nr:hypothetical protein [Candidatus Kurthia equi]
MIDIKRLYELGIEIKAEEIGINDFKLVQDESEVIKNLQNHKITDNHLLVIVIPSIDSGKTKSIDAIQFNNQMQFLVLEKRDAKSTKDNYEDMMVYKRSQDTLNNVLEYFLQHLDDEESHCEIFRNFNPSSFQIDPVKGLSDCFGWSWTFTL